MKDIRIESPLGGQLIALAEVKDAAFAAGSMTEYERKFSGFGEKINRCEVIFP